MNIREWDSFENIQGILDKQRGIYDDIFEFFVSFYHMIVSGKSFVFGLQDSLGDLDIDVLDDNCKKLFKEFLSPYSLACTDEVICWCADREFMLLLSANELTENEKSRIYMLLVLLKKTLRTELKSNALENLHFVSSLVNWLGSFSAKQFCQKKLMEIERILGENRE